MPNVQVLWELYRRGWDVGSTLEGVKAMLMQGTLRKESSTEALSKAEAALFEKAMAESWKNFGKAVEVSGSMRSVGHRDLRDSLARWR